MFTALTERTGGRWLFYFSAFAAGMAFYFPLSRNGSAGAFCLWAYDKVGVTIVGLVPLAVWALWIAYRAETGHSFTLSYIGITAQRVGLLGTVIGIVQATIAIGDKLGSGAASAVTGALPAVGQALISTGVGFVIALGCDFIIYLNETRAAGEGSTDEGN